MKKIVTMMLGLGLILGSASFAFAEDAPAKDNTKKEKKAKKTKAKKATTPATDEKK
jgi:hypothetical protein